MATVFVRANFFSRRKAAETKQFRIASHARPIKGDSFRFKNRLINRDPSSLDHLSSSGSESITTIRTIGDNIRASNPVADFITFQNICSSNFYPPRMEG